MIEMIILYCLSEKELTMYAVQKNINSFFGAYTQPSIGAIKPALTRLEDKGLLTSRKSMSDGGKLSGFYTITRSGRDELKKLILEKVSQNPLQFNSTSSLKLCCASYLPSDERIKLFDNLKSMALKHKLSAQEILNSEKSLGFYHRIILDNTIMEYKNFITLIENLEKENARNS